MFNSRSEQTTSSRPFARRSLRPLGVAGLALLLLASLTAAALAASTTLTLGSATNSTLSKQVVVSPLGRTLYTLSPETENHLLCKSSECLKRWPPVTARSGKTKLKAASGVQGHLGLLKRANGTFQVTLRGLPLYRYAGDRAKGQANGEGIESFGGTWHVVSASSSAGTPAPSAPTTPSPPTTTPSYPYPY
jgi:predicted lipoprotein with Yx(FWY)xxD motif